MIELQFKKLKDFSYACKILFCYVPGLSPNISINIGNGCNKYDGIQVSMCCMWSMEVNVVSCSRLAG
uniref:Uncharacterized protein n=1 Tax=Arundo donax TaxID=35708 RepID=A0A0A9AQ39_ARUDO